MNSILTREQRAQYLNDCTAALKASGGRITQPRLSVLTCLALASRPLSVREILAALKKDPRARSVDKVSVYRILEALLKLDLVHQIFPSGGFVACAHSRCKGTVHVITRCSRCENTEELDLPESIVEPVLWFLAKEKSFESDRHAFQINGMCAKCRSSLRLQRSAR